MRAVIAMYRAAVAVVVAEDAIVQPENPAQTEGKSKDNRLF